MKVRSVDQYFPGYHKSPGTGLLCFQIAAREPLKESEVPAVQGGAAKIDHNYIIDFVRKVETAFSLFVL